MCDNNHIPINKQAFIRSVLSVVNPVVEEEFSDLEFESDEELCHEDPEKEDDGNPEENMSDQEDDNLEEQL